MKAFAFEKCPKNCPRNTMGEFPSFCYFSVHEPGVGLIPGPGCPLPDVPRPDEKGRIPMETMGDFIRYLGGKE